MPSLLIASLIVFTLPRLIPGDVVQLMLEEKAYGKDLEDLRAKLGLNRPIHVQYFEWLGAVVRGHLGESLWTRQPVLAELARRLPVTLALGVLRCRRADPDRRARRCRRRRPPGRRAGLLRPQRRDPGPVGPGLRARHPRRRCCRPSGGAGRRRGFVEFSAGSGRGHLVQFILPAVILGIASAAGIMRLTRGMLLEVLRQDYVRTAWAKGLRERVVVLKHALKNALIPVVTVLGLQVAPIAGGAVIIEWIFGIPGMGQFLVDAIVQRDYPVIQGINLVIVDRHRLTQPHGRPRLRRAGPEDPLR